MNDLYWMLYEDEEVIITKGEGAYYLIRFLTPETEAYYLKIFEERGVISEYIP